MKYKKEKIKSKRYNIRILRVLEKNKIDKMEGNYLLFFFQENFLKLKVRSSQIKSVIKGMGKKKYKAHQVKKEMFRSPGAKENIQ